MRYTTALTTLFLICFLFLGETSVAQHPRSTKAKTLLPGNWADPCILKDGDDYYMSHSSWNFQPGTLIWHSKDLKRWRPIVRATMNSAHEIWSPYLAKYNGIYYLFLTGNGVWVSTAKHIAGPWSDPQKLDISGGDTSHVVDEKGKRYIYIGAGHAAPLSADGRSIIAPHKQVYGGWNYPKEWISGGFNLDTPRVCKRNGWYYLIYSQGGTSGPATGHMVVVARSRNVLGPWENMPSNPLIRTWDRRESFWSKGHGQLIEGPNKQWFCIMHGYPNGLRSLGRYTLIEPIEWTDDGWCKVSKKWPEGWDNAIKIDMPMSDEFDNADLGIQWQFYEKFDPARFRCKNGELEMDGYGVDPGESRPLCVTPLDVSYTIETELEVEGNATAGLMLFYHPSAYLAMALEPDGTVRRMTKELTGYGEHRNTVEGRRRVAFKIVNKRQDVQCFRKDPGGEWVPLSTSIDVAHMNHNVLGDWGALNPSLFVTGKGRARFLYFKYEPIKEN